MGFNSGFKGLTQLEQQYPQQVRWCHLDVSKNKAYTGYIQTNIRSTISI